MTDMAKKIKNQTPSATSEAEKKYTIDDDGIIVISTPKKVRRFKVNLDGELYSVKAVKGQLGLTLSVQMKAAKDNPSKIEKVIQQVINVLFDPEDQDKVRSRLEDSNDSLDMIHIMQLMEAVLEVSTGNPTT